MRILIAGSSGFVGQPLCEALRGKGWEIRRLVRPGNTVGDDSIAWDPAENDLDPAAVEWADAVVNLGGHSIAGGRWSTRIKDLLRSSRLDGTRLLVRSIIEAESPPRVLVNASAIGYYGSRGDEVLTEGSPPGDDFLADLSRAWEAAAAPAGDAGTRVVLLRFGLILGRGGALAKMLTPFRMGLGGPVGDGRQWWSWIGLGDVLRIIVSCLSDESFTGPINAVAPNPATNRDFTATLGRVLRRPAVLPAPAFALRLAMGEMADALLLASTRVRPARLEALGYEFECANLEDALRQVLRNS